MARPSFATKTASPSLSSEPPLARLDRLAPQIVAVELEQIERAMHSARERPMTSDAPEGMRPRRNEFERDLAGLMI